MNFVAIDFETATSLRTSACSIGICEVSGGRITARRSMLIRPEPFEFNDYNIKIHGITPAMVREAPRFCDCWQQIRPYIDGRLVIAHNASFDINVLCKTLDLFGLEYPTADYLCTVKLSQKAYPELESHKLNVLADAFDIRFSHHDACDDAYVCALVLLHIMHDYRIDSLQKLRERFDIGIGHISPEGVTPCSKHAQKKRDSRTLGLSLK